MAGALIVTAEIAQRDFSWLEGLRRAHFPPERNRLSAHLTLFHALPPSAETEVRARLSQFGKEKPPHASIEVRVRDEESVHKWTHTSASQPESVHGTLDDGVGPFWQ